MSRIDRMSKIDKMIGYLESVIAAGMDSAIITDPPAMLKWLKELKRLRKEVKHCKLVHGTFFDELAKQGVIA